MRVVITVDVDENGKAIIDIATDEVTPKQKPKGRHQTEHICQQCGDKYMRYRSDSNFCKKSCYQRYYNIKRGRVKAVHQQPLIRPRQDIIEFKPVLIQTVPLRKASENTDESFTDPWNCERCRVNQTVCSLHLSLEAEGKKPAIYHNYRH